MKVLHFKQKKKNQCNTNNYSTKNFMQKTYEKRYYLAD